jgi:hypothetical protein
VREQLAWPLVERGLVAWLTPRVPDGVTVLTETGTAVPAQYVTVARVGGSTSGDIERDVLVELAVFARARGPMWELAQVVESAMDQLGGNGVPLPASSALFYVDSVDVSFGWADDPLPSQDVRRATSQYALTIRPTRT